MNDSIQHGYITVNGIRMHYAAAGSGPPLLLLHGFPEFWYSWRHQFAALSPHFTVIAPDLRGYNETDKPAWGYEIDVLTRDIVEFLEALGYQRAMVAGHDWGGMLAWVLAIVYPHRVERLITLNAPHPTLIQQALLRNRRQQRRSWYVGFFQLPYLPELLFSANDYAAIEYSLRGMALRPRTFSDEDIEAYKDAVSKPGALTTMINYYRRLSGRSLAALCRGTDMQVNVPTLQIWGEEDSFLGRELTFGTERYAPDLQIRYIPNCSHWVQQEAPAEVNQAMLDFLLPPSR
jgi:pimeloyl-ACP methyl ester carboxylesterase